MGLRPRKLKTSDARLNELKDVKLLENYQIEKQVEIVDNMGSIQSDIQTFGKNHEDHNHNNQKENLTEAQEAFDQQWAKVQKDNKQKVTKIKGRIRETNDILQSCRHSSTMLMNLINDLLDLAKQESLTFEFHKSYFNLIDTVKNTFTTLEFLSKQKNI